MIERNKVTKGGYVVYEKDGHGLVVSPSDIGLLTWKNAKTACDELILNGYSDWRLPSIKELELIYKNVYKAGIGNFVRDVYWSSTEFSAYFAWYFCFFNGYANDYDKGLTYRVRAVRTFFPESETLQGQISTETKTDVEKNIF